MIGFAGKTNLEQAKIDQIVNNWYDLQEENWKAKFEKDSTKQVNLRSFCLRRQRKWSNVSICIHMTYFIFIKDLMIFDSIVYLINFL